MTLACDLIVRPLRQLTLDPRDHPRGQPHLGAASGLVCAQGRVYVVCDDEHHLAVFHDLQGPGRLVQLFPGELPHDAGARKKRKPDTESLLLWPACARWPNGALIALGSGSRRRRCVGVAVPLDPEGEPHAAAERLELEPLYGPLRERFEQLNIEGAMLLGDRLVLLQRGNKGGSVNAMLRYRLADVRRLVEEGAHASLTPEAVVDIDLGGVDGVPLCFTDAAAMPDGRWAFTAVAEHTDDNYADGACSASAVGIADADGRILALHGLPGSPKVEGIAVQPFGATVRMCLVTDADDPAVPAQLLTGDLPLAA